MSRRVNCLLSILLVMSLLFASFCPFDIYQAAEEVVDYSTGKVNVEMYVSTDDRNYTKYTLTDSSPISANVYYMQIRFYFLEPLQGNSKVQFGFYLEDYNLIDLQPEFYKSHVLSNGSVIKTLTSGYFDIDGDGQEFFINSEKISFEKGINDKINCITVYLKFDLTKSSEQISRPFVFMEYVQLTLPDKLDSMLTPTPEDQNNVNNSNSSLNDNKDQMDSMLNDMNSVEQPDADDLVANLDKYLSTDDIAAFSSVLSALFNNDIIISYVMIGLVIALVSFVLFGKKG